jgi:hypothetical protein
MLLFVLFPQWYGGRLGLIVFLVLCSILLPWMMWVIARETLVVCERGLLLGGLNRPRPPVLLVRYDQIVPGSLVPVTGVRRYSALTGRSARYEALRMPVGTTNGIHFVASDPAGARRPPSARHSFQLPAVRSFDGRWIWFATTGRTPPAEVIAEIARAARRLGLHALADAAVAADTRELTKNPADRHRLLPGYPMHSIEPMRPASPTTSHRPPGPYPPLA